MNDARTDFPLMAIAANSASRRVHGECARALDEIDRWRKFFEDFKDTLPRFVVGDKEVVLHTSGGWVLFVPPGEPTDG